MQRDVWGRKLSQTVSSFLKGINHDVCTENPITWDSKTRALLAETLGKPVPNENERTTSFKNVDIRFGAAGTDTDYKSMGGFSSAAGLKRNTSKSKEPGQKKLRM